MNNKNTFRSNKLSIPVPCSDDFQHENYLEGWCHHNVMAMCNKYGGETVLGFRIIESDDLNWWVPHSIWKSSNASYFDITSKNCDYINFLPIKTYNPKEFYWFIPYEYKFHKYQNSMCEIFNKSSLLKNISYERFLDLDIKSIAFLRNYSLMNREDWDEYIDEVSEKFIN